MSGTARYLVRSTSIDGDSRYESVDNEVTIDDLSPGTRYTFTVATLDAKERESVTRSDAVNVVTGEIFKTQNDTFSIFQTKIQQCPICAIHLL